VEEDKVSSSPAPEVTIPEVSLLLQHSREAKGLSLREAEAATRVPVHYLQLLEGKGDTRILSDALYLVPFLRTYAVFLGLDPSEATAQFIQSVHGKEDTVSELGGDTPPLRSFVKPKAFIIILAITALFTLLWLIRGH
jgi:cytoskeletal protein RodZ